MTTVTPSIAAAGVSRYLPFDTDKHNINRATPNLPTNIAVDLQWHFPMDFQWHFPTEVHFSAVFNDCLFPSGFPPDLCFASRARLSCLDVIIILLCMRYLYMAYLLCICCLRPISLLTLSLLTLLDSSFPGNPLWTWEFHPFELRLCSSPTL